MRRAASRPRRSRNSQEDIAPIVFGNAAPSVLAAMLPEQARPSFSALYNDRCPSISLWTISLGLSRRSREFGVRRYSTAILPAWVMALADIRQAGAFFRDDPGTRIPPYSSSPTIGSNSGLNPNGPYLVSMVGVDRLTNWADRDADANRMRRERWMDRIIGDLDSYFPGIAGAVVQREMSTAETFHHYLTPPRARSMASRRRPAASCRWRKRRLAVFTWHPHSPAAAAHRRHPGRGMGGACGDSGTTSTSPIR